MSEQASTSPQAPESEAARYQSLLATGERVLLVQRRHWFTFIEAGRWFVLVLVAGIVTSAIKASIPDDGIAGPLNTVLGYAFVIFLLIGVAGAAWHVILWRKERFLVTTRRVIETGGVITTYSRDTSLSMITDMLVSKPWLGRILGYSDVKLLTAAEEGTSTIRFLPDADQFKKTLLDAKHEYQLELGGAPTAAPSIAEPAPAAVATPPSDSMSADEMDAALTHLGDLRERGLITEAEFQAKKTELLGRL